MVGRQWRRHCLGRRGEAGPRRGPLPLLLSQRVARGLSVGRGWLVASRNRAGISVRELGSDAAGDRGAVGGIELLDQLVVAADQSADGGDLLLARGRIA